ncbi:SGNH/GDSL hydrolase family protein [Streptomyces alkaliterrae]|uniref:SGNH/GDSL hydrolase family protein n=1 Tax=Streptomyces alkaliterrae TaxID=2213162 RepID=A0A5P0YTL8_9ACTN|nr:SGNH/GDSL hydrolase family protein [Streptomyces alkaliterrae]MBB1254425.1 SGNH/GDSL hydrolase family protein [Streptomyces alkaliterrae]MBB1261012.1 SGNH/GDSL hydrolase family protein [Streptomyces alkaliterrae]MQS02782.1 SGNH/GDSL hydrolase family protein [Streptomyces alkaliterrae]
MTAGRRPVKSRNAGYAFLAGFAAIVVLVSTAIFVGFGGRETPRRANGGGGQAAPASSGNWVGTWATAAAASEPDAPRGHPDTSIRNIVHTSVGGTAARVQLSNLFGDRPLTIDHATLALAAAPSAPAAAPGTMRRLTFGTQESVTIPPGGTVTSDAVRLTVPHSADLLVTTYSATRSGAVTYHPFARQTSYLASGDRAAETDGSAYTTQSPYWRYVTGVDVWTTETEGAVVVIGDSITDGITSSPGANRRWPDFLAERLRTERGAPAYSVLNSGISGNRVLVDGTARFAYNGPSALARMERDALSRTGVRTVVIQLGINDILKHPGPIDPAVIVHGLERLAAQAQSRGLRVVVGTLTPFAGHRKHTPEREAARQRVNERIRASEAFDGVVDFDAALRDPAAPERMRTAYDSGDNLHPGDNGFRAMAQAVDLRLIASDRSTRVSAE